MSDQEYDGDELTESERRELRRLLDGDRKTRWLFATLRISALWIAGVIAALYAILQILRDGVKALLGPGS